MGTHRRRRQPHPRAAVGLTLATALLCWPRLAQASSLVDEVERLRSGWAGLGVQVGQLGTLFLHQGAGRAMGLPPHAGARCQTVVAVAERHVRFTLQWLDPAAGGGARAAEAAPEPAPRAPELPRRDRPVASRAGVALLSACDVGPGDRRNVRIAMHSTHGTVEVLVARHDDALPPVGLVVPERAIGPVAPPSLIRRPRVVESLDARVTRAQAAAKLDGARSAIRVDHRASAAGTGVLGLKLSAGCHRLVVMAASAQGGGSAADVDAEVRRPDEARALQRDRSFAPHARLDFCLGEAGPVQLRLRGAPALGAVAVVAAHWPLPAAIAGVTGSERRRVLAAALARRPTPAPRPPALRQIRGGPGTTLLPVAVEPGACYLAALGVEEGAVEAARLSASVADGYVRDQSSEPPHGVAVSFCAGRATMASLQVEVRSPFAWWTLMLWRVHRGGR